MREHGLSVHGLCVGPTLWAVRPWAACGAHTVGCPSMELDDVIHVCVGPRCDSKNG